MSASAVHKFAVDIFENDQSYVFVADLPGVNAAGLGVEFERDTLSIVGKTDDDEEFRRRFTLPQVVDVESAKAELKIGVLTLTLPKAAARARTITVMGD